MATAEELKVELIAEEKYHEDRIGHVERNYASLAQSLAGIVRKTALMRDKGDKLTMTIKDMVAGETGKLKTALDSVSDCYGALEDYRQTELDRLEAKVVKPLLEYESICRKAKDELKSCHANRAKVINQQRSLDRTRIKEPTNNRKLNQLEIDLQKAKFTRLQSAKMLDSHMSGFEKKRVHDLKEILKEYVHTEMLFHAKAMELLTLSYQHLESINEDEAVEVFMSNLQLRKRRGIIIEDPLPPVSTPTLTQRTNSEPSLVSNP